VFLTQRIYFQVDNLLFDNLYKYYPHKVLPLVERVGKNIIK